MQVRQRRTAMRMIGGWIAARGPLRDGLSVNRAAQVVWTLTSPEVHLLMRDTGGRSQRSYRAWLDRYVPGNGLLQGGLIVETLGDHPGQADCGQSPGGPQRPPSSRPVRWR